MPNYGNVPAESVQAMRSAAQLAERVVAHLPAGSPDAWRASAYEEILEGLMQDWLANGSSEWDTEDERELAAFLHVCADVAREQILRDVAFRTLLKHAVQDWLENW